MHVHHLRVPAALLMTALCAAQGTDSIVKADGTAQAGVEVTAMTLTEIKFTLKGEEKTLPGASIAEVRWGGAPETFTSGMAALQRNDFETARQMFGDAVNATERAPLKAEARFLQCKAAVGSAQADKAAAASAAGALRAWISEFPDAWHLPEALLLLGRGLRLGGMYDDAAAALKDLDEKALGGGWAPAWSARGKFELALALLEQGKPLEARAAFQAASGAAESAIANTTDQSAQGEMKTLKVQARVGEGETLVREKNYTRAADFFRTMAGDEDLAVKAAGRAGEGEATFLIAADKKDAAQLRLAQIALAEAAVLDVTSGDTSAKANYYLGRVELALGDRDGDDFKNRAKAYFLIVSQSYPGSRWAGPAREQAK